MKAVMTKGENIEVITNISGFNYDAENREILLMPSLDHLATVKKDTSEWTVSIEPSGEDWAYYEFLSDEEEKRREEQRKIEKENKIRDAEKIDMCVKEKKRFPDSLSELEYFVKEYCMRSGYADEDEEWFIIKIETGYKKKVLVVNILSNAAATTQKKSVFESDSVSGMFAKAISFYRGGCLS